MADLKPDIRRRLPAVDQLLSQPEYERLAALYGRDSVRKEIREGLAGLRQRISALSAEESLQIEDEIDQMTADIRNNLDSGLGQRIARVLNCTGIFLHTNLGRAPLPRSVADDLVPLLDAYCDLEIDLQSGRRSERNRRAEALLLELTGAEAALVANNNAAALLLVLSTLARDKQVVVSRGELVEIGGSFRIPDILKAAGADLVEVGTTNRTRLSDYEHAIGPRTGLLLKVDPSNYQMTGFVESVEASRLADLGQRLQIPVLVDEGSGVLRPHYASQLSDHESIQELLEAGCDLVCGSGDKMLGGPQAGLLLGSRDLVERCRRNALYRALRPDRAVFGALEAVLRLHLSGAELPIDRLWCEPQELNRRLRSVAESIGAEIVQAEAFVGGGAAPERPIQGEALALPGSSSLLECLRLGDPPVVGYIREGRLLLDLRTLDPQDDSLLVEAVLRARTQI
jgi:L-seryl-tRNA(Ser) seleniumtransferase